MTRDFLLDSTERAIKTAAQTLIAAFVGNVTVVDLDWAATGAIVGTATLLSVLTSLLSLNLGVSGTASATTAVVTVEQADEDVKTAQALATGLAQANLRNGPAQQHNDHVHVVKPQTPDVADHAAPE